MDKIKAKMKALREEADKAADDAEAAKAHLTEAKARIAELERENKSLDQKMGLTEEDLDRAESACAFPLVSPHRAPLPCLLFPPSS